MLITIMFILQIFSYDEAQPFDEVQTFIQNHCQGTSALANYNSFIEDIKKNDFVLECANEDGIIRNYFNIFHTLLYKNLFAYVSSNEATNICEALEMKSSPSTLHYAFLINQAYKTKSKNFDYFKIFNHYGVFYDSDLISAQFYISILSTQLNDGVACSMQDYIKMFNENKNPNIDGEDLATNKDFSILKDNIFEILLDEIKRTQIAIETSKESYEENKIENDFDYSLIIDNPDISIYLEEGGIEVLDVYTRSLINTVINNNFTTFSACFTNPNTLQIIDFQIKNSEIYSQNQCFSQALNEKLLPLMQNNYDLKVLGLVKI